MQRRQLPAARRYYAGATAAAAVTCVLLVFAHTGSLRTVVSAHGLLHTAIADRFADTWVPSRPENAFFAGEPVPYYWFYHYVAARIAGVTATHPLIAFEVLDLLAAALTWLLGAALGRALGWRPAASVAIGFLAIAGANPFGSLILLSKLAAGRPWPVDDGAYLWGLTHPVLGLMRFNDPGALYGPLINFFLNTTSRPLSLALALGSLISLRRYLEAGSRRHALAMVAWIAASTVFSPIIGLLAAGAVGGVLVVLPLLPVRWGEGEARWTARAWIAAAALLAGCVVVAPTYYFLFARSGQQGVMLGFRAGLVATIAVAGGPLVLLAIAGILRQAGQRRFLTILLLSGLGLMLANCLILLPDGNDTNLFHVAVFLLAVPAAGTVDAAARWPRAVRCVAAAAFIVLLTATSGLVLFAYWHRPAIALQTDGRLLRLDPGEPLAAAYGWIRTATPQRAIFILADAALEDTPVGNVPQFPALTNRLLFVSGEPDYMVVTYRDYPRRRQIAADALAGRLSAQDRTYLTSLGRPVRILVAKRDAAATLRESYGAPVYDDGVHAVFTVVD